MSLVYFAVAWTAGILLAKGFDIPWQVLPLFALSALLGLFLWRDDRRVQKGAICVLAFALGAGRFSLAVTRFDEKSLATYNGEWVTFEGLVVGEPDERDEYTNLRVRARRLLLPDGVEREVDGLALVSTARYPRHKYGDEVRVEGELEIPWEFEGFSYRDYLAQRRVYSMMVGAQVDLMAENQANPLILHLLAFKRRAQESIAGILSEPQAGLLTGILLGVESGIPDELMADFSATGTTHLIAISGFNITIISGIFASLAQRVFDRRRATLVAMGGVVIYTLLIGASAAVVRAALMGLLYLFGRYIGRPSYAPVSLAAAAFALTTWNPHVLWDVGFLLSFAATAGLMLYTEPLERAVGDALGRIMPAERAQQMADLVSETFLMTVAAQITTAPILLAAFGQLSLVTLLSNLLVLPFQPYLMITGGVATLLGLIRRPLGQFVGWAAWVFLTYTIEMVRWTADLPLASVPVDMDGWMVGVYYGLLGGVGWWITRPKERRMELWGQLRAWFSSTLVSKTLIGGAVILLVLALFLRASLPDGRLHVSFLDVGQGDAIFIQTPSGRQALIDGGPSPSVLLSHLGRRMGFWDRSLDLMVLTHPDADHITGLVSALERYRVEKVVFREIGCDDAMCDEWWQLVEDRGATVYRGEAGLEIELDEGLQLEVLHPGVELLAGEGFNDNSLVTRLTYGDASMLLTGDIQAKAERRLLADKAHLRSTVLKVAHHGGCDSTTTEFLEAVDPRVLTISVGDGNDFDHPCDAVLRRLNGRTVYRTDKHGTVTLITDGKQMWVRTERMPK
jgi:competence protein ComEC